MTGYVGLLKIEFPDYTLRLSEGGFIVFDGETYVSSDALFGAIGGVESLSEGVGQEVPVFELVLLPPGSTSPAEMAKPGYQRSRARFWLAEYSPTAGTLVGTPQLKFDGEIDEMSIETGAATRSLSITVVSNTARLIERNIGNSLSATFHKGVWPGETGHDNATGLGRAVAWGVEAPPAGSGYGGFGFGGFGNGLNGRSLTVLP